MEKSFNEKRKCVHTGEAVPLEGHYATRGQRWVPMPTQTRIQRFARRDAPSAPVSFAGERRIRVATQRLVTGPILITLVGVMGTWLGAREFISGSRRFQPGVDFQSRARLPRHVDPVSRAGRAGRMLRLAYTAAQACGSFLARVEQPPIYLRTGT